MSWEFELFRKPAELGELRMQRCSPGRQDDGDTMGRGSTLRKNWLPLVANMPKLGHGGDQLAKAITFLAYMVGPRAIAHLIAESASIKNDIGSMGVFIEKSKKK